MIKKSQVDYYPFKRLGQKVLKNMSAGFTYL